LTWVEKLAKDKDLLQISVNYDRKKFYSKGHRIERMLKGLTVNASWPRRRIIENSGLLATDLQNWPKCYQTFAVVVVDGVAGATTLSVTTFSLTTLSITTLSIMTLSIMTLSVMTLSIMTLSIMTLSIMALSVTTLSVSTLSIIIINKTQYSAQRRVSLTLSSLL
jgi:hypothetical protein